ncbi:MAG: hypothetical protein ABIB11_03715, partial [Candidatus Omnitrophota bacterium]
MKILINFLAYLCTGVILVSNITPIQITKPAAEQTLRAMSTETAGLAQLFDNENSRKRLPCLAQWYENGEEECAKSSSTGIKISENEKDLPRSFRKQINKSDGKMWYFSEYIETDDYRYVLVKSADIRLETQLKCFVFTKEPRKYGMGKEWVMLPEPIYIEYLYLDNFFMINENCKYMFYCDGQGYLYALDLKNPLAGAISLLPNKQLNINSYIMEYDEEFSYMMILRKMDLSNTGGVGAKWTDFMLFSLLDVNEPIISDLLDVNSIPDFINLLPSNNGFEINGGYEDENEHGFPEESEEKSWNNGEKICFEKYGDNVWVLFNENTNGLKVYSKTKPGDGYIDNLVMSFEQVSDYQVFPNNDGIAVIIEDEVASAYLFEEPNNPLIQNVPAKEYEFSANDRYLLCKPGGDSRHFVLIKLIQSNEGNIRAFLGEAGFSLTGRYFWALIDMQLSQAEGILVIDTENDEDLINYNFDSQGYYTGVFFNNDETSLVLSNHSFATSRSAGDRLIVESFSLPGFESTGSIIRSPFSEFVFFVSDSGNEKGLFDKKKGTFEIYDSLETEPTYTGFQVNDRLKAVKSASAGSLKRLGEIVSEKIPLKAYKNLSKLAQCDPNIKLFWSLEQGYCALVEGEVNNKCCFLSPHLKKIKDIILYKEMVLLNKNCRYMI